MFPLWKEDTYMEDTYMEEDKNIWSRWLSSMEKEVLNWVCTTNLPKQHLSLIIFLYIFIFLQFTTPRNPSHPPSFA